MNQNVTSKWNKLSHFAYLTFSIYLIFYFLFISNFIGGEFYEYNYLKDVNKPFRYITTIIVAFINRVFIHRDFPGMVYGDDNYWNLIAQIFWLLISIIIAWICKPYYTKKKIWAFYCYIQIFARYYLAFVLFIYGFDKVDYNQFKAPPSTLAAPIGDVQPIQIFRSFMNTSKSYEFFAGFIEIAAAVLLLFRRTSILGSLLGILVLLNVLMLNIGFDISLKLEIINLIFFCIYIFIPHIKNILTYFLSLQDKFLPDNNSQIYGSKKWIKYVLKISIIGIVVFMLVHLEIRWYNETNFPPYKNLMGTHIVNDMKIAGKDVEYEKKWKKLTFNYDPSFGLELMNAAGGGFVFTLDTVRRVLDFRQVTPEKAFGVDTMVNGKLYYTNVQKDLWKFEGIFNNDSISFTTRQIEIYDNPLLRGYGKMTWFYW